MTVAYSNAPHGSRIIASTYGAKLRLTPFMKNGRPGDAVGVSLPDYATAMPSFKAAELAEALNGIVPGFEASYVKPPRFTHDDFESDESDGVPDKFILTIYDEDEEIAIIVHRTNGGEFPLDGEVANEKRQQAAEIVAALNAAEDRIPRTR